MIRDKVMQGETPPWWILTMAALSVCGSCLSSATPGTVCERGKTWWHRQSSTCLPCTLCDPANHQAVRLPCELHRDTVCHTIHRIQLFNELNSPALGDSPGLGDSPSAPILNSSEDYYDVYDEVPSDDYSAKWDVQTSTLTIAASGCVVFFVVVVFLSLYHAKQWKVLKKALQSDVKDLSAKLRLMEAGVEPPREQAISPNHHIYCNIHHTTKNGFIGPASGKGLANFYTQEKQQP